MSKLLLSENTIDLIKKTVNVNYEKYRKEKLSEIICTDIKKLKDGETPFTALLEEEKLIEKKLKKMEEEMEMVFQKKVEEKNKHLKRLELAEMESVEKQKQFVNLEKAELFSLRANHEKEKIEWEKNQKKSVKYSKSTESLSRKKYMKMRLGTLKLGRQ